MTSPAIDIRVIREHKGSRNRGFGELVVELIPWIDEEVRRLEVVRHGTLDGGVEAHF